MLVVPSKDISVETALLLNRNGWIFKCNDGQVRSMTKEVWDEEWGQESNPDDEKLAQANGSANY